MRLMKGRSQNPTYHVIQDIMRDGKRSTQIVENLGNRDEICAKYNVSDADAWAKEYIKKRNEQESEIEHKRLVPFFTDRTIAKGDRLVFNVGYLFLQQIYYRLGLQTIAKKVQRDSAFSYDLDGILSRLIYGRILFPSSKLSCLEQSRGLLEEPRFELHQIYRALSVLSEHADFIQAELYKRSKAVIKRSTGVLFYDCTNYFFEVEQEKGLKQYGLSKEHRPNPIVQMGLFMDKTGIPLAFCINPGNQNEQLSLQPLEKQIMKDFELSKFVVCTDAGLSSAANKRFNNFGERSFITTQSIKKLPAEVREWALARNGWYRKDEPKEYDLSQIEDTQENLEKVFYKQRYLEGYDEERDISFNQTLVVTYSLKYKHYQQSIREKQLERARKYLEHPSGLEKCSQTDAKRFIKKTSVTQEGEIACGVLFSMDEKALQREAQYDGFYAVTTNLDEEPWVIAKINHDRWEIEESFRIMKSEFSARPVYLQRDDRIRAHFLTCFIALLIYRILEKKLGSAFPCGEVIETLRGMNMRKLSGHGYIPSYTRTNITDALHQSAGFRTDLEILSPKSIAGVIRRSKGL